MTRIRWLLVAVTGIALLLLSGVVWLLHTESGARYVFASVQRALEAELTAADLSGSFGAGITLRDAVYDDGTVRVSAATLALAADIDLFPVSVELHDTHADRLRVVVRNSGSDDNGATAATDILTALQLPVWLFLDALTVTDATIVTDDAAEPFAIDSLTLTGRWGESIRVDELVVITALERATLSGSIGLSSPHRLRAEAALTSTRELVGSGDEFRVDAQLGGTIDAVEVEMAVDARTSDYRPLQAKLSGLLSADALDVSAFTVAGDDLRASGRGRLSWAGTTSVVADVGLERANVHAAVPAWPEAHPLTGSLSISYEPGRLLLRNTRLQVSGTNAELVASADVDVATGDVAADLSWHDLQWPVAAPTPEVSSSIGNVVVSGTVDAWTISGDIRVEAGDLDEGGFDITGRGDRERASVTIRDSVVLGGRLRGEAAYEWIGERPWSASLEVSEIDVGLLNGDWPGVLSGGIDARGRAADRWLRADLTGLSGRLRERPFSASGGVELDGSRFTAHALSLDWGTTTATLDGDAYADSGLRFEAHTEDIGEWLDDARGSIDASGAVSLSDGNPWLRFDATAATFEYGDFYISDLRVRDLGRDAVLAVDVVAADVSAGGERVLEPRAELVVEREQQSLALTGTYNDLRFELRTDGAFDDWQRREEWNGTLRQLAIDAADGASATLTDAVPLRLSRERIVVDRLCLREAAGAGLCARIDWQPGRQIDLAADVDTVPVALINRFQDTGFDFDQTVSGTLRWLQVTNQRASGAADVAISPGRIVSRETPTLVVATETGRLAFTIEDGRLLAGTLTLPMPGTGDVDAQFSVLDVTNVANSDIAGQMTFELQDIAVVAVLSPLIDTARGRLNGRISAGGTIDAPQIEGTFELANGSISYLPLGLHLRDVNLNGALEDEWQIRVDGGFRAGDGRGEIRTRADWTATDARGINVELRGQQLRLIDVPDVQAMADVDLGVQFDGRSLTLGGRILIPTARIQPENLPATRATESEDVVIVAGRLPDERERNGDSELDMRGEVELALGDDVVVDLDVASAKVSGAATYRWNGGPIPTASGRYTISGDIQAFGQVLTIVEGGIRYPNVPANDPQLRIRAEREIYGNTQVKSAGVLVQGTLTNPTIDAYTYPPTTEERALTLLVTGNDFNYEQGVGAIAFGTYVAPRLFVSYGVGLFGRDNVISARYDLTSGFGIKATSGQQESGFDLIYRFER
ncbi:MAG: translocation/assembly module TamB domain-containing protein [Woeseiaceae bacterium]|nr:translocation/assembly module TamB domain-containing protein [Woeseiaceae bacterium]